MKSPLVTVNDDGTLQVIPFFVVAGYLTAIIFFSIWSIAAAVDGEWIFGWNALSDLGVADSSASRILFNYGCVITALFGGHFGMGLFRYERGWLYLSGFLVMVGVLFLMGVGSIPESYGKPHFICASTFGGFAILAMLCSAIGDLKAGRRVYSAIAFLLLFACVALELSMQLANLRFGYFEAISIINILIWVISQSVKYHRMLGKVTVDDPVRKFFKEINSKQ